MNKRAKFIYAVISIIAVLFPIGFLLDVLSARVAFPIVFVLLGCQQLFNGLLVTSKDNRSSRLFSIISGALFIVFGILIVFPSYNL